MKNRENVQKRSKNKSERRNGLLRLIVAAFLILLQGVWFVLAFTKLGSYYRWISMAVTALSFFIVLVIYGTHINSAQKISWTILIFALPVLGIFMYIWFTVYESTGFMKKRYAKIDSQLFPLLPADGTVLKKLERTDFTVANMFRYVSAKSHFPVYDATDTKFFPHASDAFEVQLEAVKKAKKFIFMEYFAVEDTEAFHELESILVKKVSEGVEVRLLYDDIGSISYVTYSFKKRLEAEGIRCRVFNPVLFPVFHVFLNHRDHRKITVVDGKIGFTGGYNIANEYFNITHPHGYWKDTGVKLEGDAVKSLTMMFLETWNAINIKERNIDNFDKYLSQSEPSAKSAGFIQPYADSPMDHAHTGEDVYMNIINAAKHYVYISTPYLIIMDEMSKALCLASERGVDVRIITPGIPDKKIIYKLTRSYYTRLVRSGVRIFEYTPGFNHAKQVVSDDCIATCGTVNFDFRSFYYHFEDGVLMYNCDAVGQIKRDFEITFPQCREVTEKYRSERNIASRFTDGLFRLFAPLL